MSDTFAIDADDRPMPAVLAIDPGPEKSAWLWLEDGAPDVFDIWPNEQIAAGWLRGATDPSPVVVIEAIESFGMAVGREVFETVRWVGRFEEAARRLHVVFMPRRAVKLHLCNSAKAKDANVRAALIDRFGGPSATRKGGPLYRISRDVWSALALAITYADGAAG